jgi:hypothetical protein
MADPFREQRFDPRSVRRILKKAAELADKDASEASDGRALTRDELEQAAADLGLPARAVAEAMRSDDDQAASGTREQEHNWFIGAPTRIVLDEEVPGEPSEEDREDLIEEIHAAIGGGGSVERVGKTLVWNMNPGYRGRGRSLSIRVRSRDGKTRIIIEESLTNPATGLFVGLGVGGGIGPMGGYIMAMVKLGAIGMIFPLLWIPLMLLLARTIFGAMSRRRQRDLEKLMARLKRRAAGWSPTKVRVASSASADAEAEREADAEREAESDDRRAARRN